MPNFFHVDGKHVPDEFSILVAAVGEGVGHDEDAPDAGAAAVPLPHDEAGTLAAAPVCVFVLSLIHTVFLFLCLPCCDSAVVVRADDVAVADVHGQDPHGHGILQHLAEQKGFLLSVKRRDADKVRRPSVMDNMTII